MRPKTPLLVALAVLAAVAGLTVALLAPAFRDAPAADAVWLMTAIQNHAGELQARGQPVPPAVTLEDLIAAGHLTRADAQAFQGARVIFHTGVTETMPQQVLCEAHLPDGTIHTVLGDGCVQQMSPARRGVVRTATPK